MTSRALVSRFVFPLLGLFLLNACASTEDAQHASGEVLPEYVFSPSDNPVNEVEQLVSKAKQSNKLALVVLGAQWCHDSRGLAENFSKPEMQSILNKRFETLFVDVGFLNDRRDVTSMFDYPAYFATPTVLIIDPASGKLINQSSLTTWQSAYSVPFEDYMQHFSSISSDGQGYKKATGPQADLLDNFTRTQVDRLYNGYQVLGPLLESDVTGKLDNTDELNRLWFEVREFRMTLQKDIHALREQLAENPEKALVIPSYPQQSWEK